MKKRMKIIAIGLAVIAVIGFAIYWNHPAHIYSREISQLRKIYSSENQNGLSVIIERNATDGDWGKLERAVKDYVKNRTESLATLEEIKADDELTTALDADKLRANSPDFSNILTKLKNTKITLESAREKFDKVQSIDEAVNQLGSDMNDEFKTRYREELEKDFAVEDSRINNADAFRMLQGMVDTYIAELELLAKNPKAWNVDSGVLKITDRSIKKQYDAILEDVKKIQ